MTKAARSPVTKFETWSVTDWSVQHELLTLNLGLFLSSSRKIDQEMYYRASCRFVRPSRVRFSKFTPSTKTVIQRVHVAPPSRGLTTYKFEFEHASFIEIVARDCSTVRW
jgi:hypothetical protein